VPALGLIRMLIPVSYQTVFLKHSFYLRAMRGCLCG
jgi:hypothetical protein